MNRKAVSGTMLTLLSVSMLTLAFNIQPVRNRAWNNHGDVLNTTISDGSECLVSVEEIFEDVTTATGYRYYAHDNRGHGLDGIKIIENPQGGYLGVYHSFIGGFFHVRLANSTDLLRWTFVRTIEQDASQPTIAQAPTGAYVVAFEKEDASSHLKLHYHSNVSTLINSPPDFTIDISRTLSSFHEGTPNVYNITIKDSVMNACIAFHYYNGSVDHAAVGWLTVPLDNPESYMWNTSDHKEYDQKLREDWNVKGNIGDRDYGRIFGRNFTLQEGNLDERLPDTNWAAWRIFLYDHSTGNFTKLNIKTHKGSTSFGNPTFTLLKSPNGRNAIVVTYYLFSEGAEIREAGPLIFYKELLVGDLNDDGTVNILDISIVAVAFGTKEGDDRYDPIADLDGNKQINILDISIVALDYGKTV
jgi:hypothetical protein